MIKKIEEMMQNHAEWGALTEDERQQQQKVGRVCQ